MRRLVTTILAGSLAIGAFAGGALAGGPPGLSFYVDGAQYRTVGTPTDFFGTGAPAHTYDTIYALGGDLANVAEAKPGDTDYNGGRWLVRPVTWHVTPVQLTSAEDVEAWADLGFLSIGDPVRSFLCPVIPVPGRG